MVSFIKFAVLVSGLLAIGAGHLASASPTPLNKLSTRDVDCTGVAPSLGGQACGGNAVMTCLSTTIWSCPSGDTGVVPPDTECICNAFRHPGWVPNNSVPPGDCTSGIVCVPEGGTQFRVCGVSGLQPLQDVPAGTVCRNGGITWP